MPGGSIVRKFLRDSGTFPLPQSTRRSQRDPFHAVHKTVCAEIDYRWSLQEPLLAELYGASISGRVATGPRAGKRIVRVGDGPDSENAVMKPGHCCALVEGFSVHAGVCVAARDRVQLERLLRYASRPPLSNERLSLLPDGKLLYRLKRRWSDGTTHVIYEPMELMIRLAALVPPPRFNVTRYAQNPYQNPQIFYKMFPAARFWVLNLHNCRLSVVHATSA